MNESTNQIIKKYQEAGWVFSQISWPENKSSLIKVFYRFKSPRMESVEFIPDGFTENEILIKESEYYASQIHGGQIYNSISPVIRDLIKQLGNIYRLRDRDKIVPIPSEIIIKEVKIILSDPIDTIKSDNSGS
jgi:hypothetical protein